MILHTLEELEADLQSSGFRPFYLIMGPEDYQCRLAVNLLKNKVLPPESIAFDYNEFFAPDTPVQVIIETANLFPMLSKRRLVLVAGIERIPESEQDTLMAELVRLSSRCVMVLFALDLDHRKRFYRTLREKSCVVEFPKLKGAALERWAESYARKQGFRISSESIKKIVDLVGSDLRALAAEIEKVFLYAGKGKDIPDSAIDNLVRNSRQYGIFDLVNAVARHDRAGALRTLANLLNTGEPPLVIVTMLARHCRQVLIVRDCLARKFDAREAGMAAQIPSFMLDDFLRHARTADAAAVREMHVRLADVDRMLKSTSLDPRMLLEQVICAMI